MNEAMAAGNIIISRNVGQTELFVKDGVNGLLLKSDNPDGLADAINWVINNTDKHEKMATESVKLTTQVHNFENFRKQLESFGSKFIMIKYIILKKNLIILSNAVPGSEKYFEDWLKDEIELTYLNYKSIL